MISIKNALLGALVVAIIRVYFSYGGEKESFAAFTQSFEDTCVEEANKGVTDPRATALIKPVCKCVVQNNEMQAELKSAYDTQDITQAKQKIKIVADRIIPLCIQQVMR